MLDNICWRGKNLVVRNNKLCLKIWPRLQMNFNQHKDLYLIKNILS